MKIPRQAGPIDRQAEAACAAAVGVTAAEACGCPVFCFGLCIQGRCTGICV